MQAFTRRSVLAGGVAGIALGTIPVSFRTKASAAGMRIRYSAASPEGKDMLVSYARAVAAMMDLDRTSPGDPRSWTFQWYTHWVQGNGAPADKQNALQAIYGGDPDSPNARLAQAMWSTCQPHFGGRSDDFLPWHRMYVYYYEQIIRELSGNPDFTLPYWDYTNPDLQALPPEFLKQGDPVYGSLWRANRDQDVNAGAPITADHPAGSLNLNCLRSPAYGTRIGFCALLNGNPHGIVHDYVGNEQGMGAVPWAANDPIFWLHHSNVDRIWASWNTRYRNPDDADWLNTSYTFVNGTGARVDPVIGAFLATEPLGYGFDELLPVPQAPERALMAAAAMEPRVLAVTSGLTLGAGPVRTMLDTPMAAASEMAVARAVRELDRSREIYLSLVGVRAPTGTEAVYDAYLGLPPGTEPDPSGPHYAGTFSLFEAGSGHAGHGGHGGVDVTINVTGTVRSLRERGLMDADPALTLVADGATQPDAVPTVEKVELIAG